MRKRINTSLIIITIAFVSGLSFSSCNKDKNDPTTTSVPLIATSMSYNKDGVLNEMTSYQYDTNRRLTKMTYEDGSYDLVEYSGSAVIIKRYKDGKLDYLTVAELNNKGLCISLSSHDEYYLSTYDYDSNSYCKTHTSESATRIRTEWRTISDGNYVTINSQNNPKTTKSATLSELDYFHRSVRLNIFEKKHVFQNNLKSTADYDDETNYQFYTDKTNTIEYENMGVSFLGKQNKNPIKQETFIFPGYVYGGGYGGYGNQTITETTTYTYEYDNKARITKQMEDNGSYSIFTYIN